MDSIAVSYAKQKSSGKKSPPTKVTENEDNYRLEPQE